MPEDHQIQEHQDNIRNIIDSNSIGGGAELIRARRGTTSSSEEKDEQQEDDEEENEQDDDGDDDEEQEENEPPMSGSYLRRMRTIRLRRHHRRRRHRHHHRQLAAARSPAPKPRMQTYQCCVSPSDSGSLSNLSRRLMPCWIEVATDSGNPVGRSDTTESTTADAESRSSSKMPLTTLPPTPAFSAVWKKWRGAIFMIL